MRKAAYKLATACAMAALMGSLALTSEVSIAAEKKMSAAEMGKKVAFDRKKGNCLGCHAMEGAVRPAGNIGPPLLAMKQRYPDKAKLRAQIWDATVMNPNTTMPPFGRHEILTGKEIDQIVEFMYTL